MAQDKLINLNALSRYKTNYDTLLAAKTNDTSIAPAFSTSETYERGDVVIYNNKFYVFTTPHSGAWDSEDVFETTVAAVMASGAMSSAERSKLSGLYVPKTYRGRVTSDATDPTDQYIEGKLDINDIDPATLKEDDIVFFKADYEINLGIHSTLSDNVKVKVTYNNTNYYIYLRQPYYDSLESEYIWNRTGQLIVPKGGMLVLSGFRQVSSTNFDCNIINFVNNNQFVLKGWLYEGDTTLTFTDSRLTSYSVLEVFFDQNHYDLTWNTFTENISPFGFSLTFDAQSEDVLVTVLVTNVTSNTDAYDGVSS